ncbi:MAG: bis-aminopropyl spermidine synthase family protein [Elusimicrobia bacterium]|nr:bis-aminopropyl spermidine synthase family protein [Elusimicrobiota bacterium]
MRPRPLAGEFRLNPRDRAFCERLAVRLGRLSGRELAWPPRDDAAFHEILAALELKRVRCHEVHPFYGWTQIRSLFMLVAGCFNENWKEACLDGPTGLFDLYFEQARACLVRRWEEHAHGLREGGDGLPVFDTPDSRYHQQPCTSRTANDRASLVAESAGSRPPRVLLAGDDDLVSLRLAHKTGWRIDVVDIDARVLEVVRAEAAKRGLPVVTHRADLFSGAPGELAGRFDVVCVDPPYGHGVCRAFLESSLPCLARTGAERLYLCLSLPMLGARVSDLEGVLEGRGLRRARTWPMFNEYPIPPGYDTLIRRIQWLLREREDEVFLGFPSFFSDLLEYRVNGAAAGR